MWRFVLRENIRRLRALMAQEQSGAERQKLSQFLKEAEAELADIERVSTPPVARSDAALESLAGRAVHDAMKLSGAQFGSLQIYDKARAQLMILAQRNFRAPFLHSLALMKPGDGSACGRCLAAGASAAVADVNTDPAFEPHREAAREAGFRAVHASPVRDAGGTLMAVLSTYYSAPRSFSDDDLYRMDFYADSISLGLERHLRR